MVLRLSRFTFISTRGHWLIWKLRYLKFVIVPCEYYKWHQYQQNEQVFKARPNIKCFYLYLTENIRASLNVIVFKTLYFVRCSFLLCIKLWGWRCKNVALKCHLCDSSRCHRESIPRNIVSKLAETKSNKKKPLHHIRIKWRTSE